MGNTNEKPNKKKKPYKPYNAYDMNNIDNLHKTIKLGHDRSINDKIVLCDDSISNDIMGDNDMIISALEFCKHIFSYGNSSDFPTLYKMCIRLNSTLRTNVNHKEIFRIGLKWEYLLLEILFGFIRRHHKVSCILDTIENHNTYANLTKECLYDNVSFSTTIYNKCTQDVLIREYEYIQFLSTEKINKLLEEIIRYEFRYDAKKYSHISISISNEDNGYDCKILNKIIITINKDKCPCKVKHNPISYEHKQISM